jgi:hypothetical protein
VTLSTCVRVLCAASVLGALFVPVASAITPTPTPTIPPCAIGTTCEAENVIRGGGVVVSTVHTGYTGTGFADYPGTGAGFVEWPVYVPTAGTYVLSFSYANGGTTDRPMAIAVNGTTIISSMSFQATGSWTTWILRQTTVSLPAGLIKIRATELPNGPNVDSLKVTTGETPTPTFTSTPTPTFTSTPTPTTPAGGCAIGATCEAEKATLAGGVVVSTLHAGYTGTGFADYAGNGTGYVEWTVNVPTAGTYALNFRYGNGGTTDRPMAIAVNGTTVVSSMSFPSTSTWTNWLVRTQNVSLPAGTVKIRATELPNGPNVDSLTLTGIGPTPTPWVTGYMQISVSKVDPKIGDTVTVTASGNTGLGSFSLIVEGAPIFAEQPAPSPSNGGTSWSWNLTVAQPGIATFKASTYGETQNGCSSCFVWATVSASSSSVTASSASATPVPSAPQGFVSNTVWRNTSANEVLVRADATGATAPTWSIQVTDTSTGALQDPANPIVTLKSQGPVSGPSAGSLAWWTFTPVRAGSVIFQTTVNAGFPCGTGCNATRTVSANSWAQTF